MIYVNVWQPNNFPLIEIQLSRSSEEFSGYVAARKEMDFNIRKPAPASVMPNISYNSGLYTPDEAREISDLWSIAATTAKMLDRMVKTRDDLYRPIAARMMASDVVLDWVDQPAAPARKERG